MLTSASFGSSVSAASYQGIASVVLRGVEVQVAELDADAQHSSGSRSPVRSGRAACGVSSGAGVLPLGASPRRGAPPAVARPAGRAAAGPPADCR